MSEVSIPLGAIDSYALPPPSRLHRIDGQVCNYSDWQAGGALLHAKPDAQVRPDQFEMQWNDIPAATVNAIRAHFAAYGAGTWAWFYPRTTTALVVIYVEPPSITWNHRVGSASARALIELAVAR